jgi:hypothetical protein
MTLLQAWSAIDVVERTARLRALRALVRVLGDGAAAGVETAIADAEHDISLLPAAEAERRLPRELQVFSPAQIEYLIEGYFNTWAT